MTQSRSASHALGPEQTFGFSTSQVHAGEQVDSGHGARINPIYLSAGFVFDDFDEARARFAGEDDGYMYTRVANPTNAAVERRIAALEHGAGALVVGSGQAAVSVALLSLLRAGDHVLSARRIYEGTRGLLRENFERFGIEVDFVDDANDPDEWRRRIRPQTRVLFGESIANPRNEILDIELVARLGAERGIPLVIDNTLATPYLVRPIEHGAAVVVHSASKFLAGHGASLGGVIVDSGSFDWVGHGLFEHLTRPDAAGGGKSYAQAYGPDAYLAYARHVIAARLGPALSPLHAFLLEQGIETLSLRVERHSANALAVARWLQTRPEVDHVDYAGLESNQGHQLAQRYLAHGFGSVFSFSLKGGQDAAATFIDALQLFSRMTHLGDVRSLAIHAATTSHAHLSGRERDELGIDDGLVRLSVGIEDADDLIRDLQRALTAVADLASDDLVAPHRDHLAATL